MRGSFLKKHPAILEDFKDTIVYRLDYFGSQQMINIGQVKYDDVIFFPTGFDFIPTLNRFGFKKGTNWVRKDFYLKVIEDSSGFDDPYDPIQRICYVISIAIVLDISSEVELKEDALIKNWELVTIDNDGYDDMYLTLKNGNKIYDYETLLRYAKSLAYQEEVPKKESHYVYRLYKSISDFRAGGECYIGITNNIKNRMRQHLRADKSFEWVQLIKVPSREDALVAEQALIAFNPNSHLENKVKRSDYKLIQTTGTHSDMKSFLCNKEGVWLTDEEFGSLIHINEITWKGDE